MTTAAHSGHPTSCLSCAELITALFFHEMSYDPKKPFAINNDEFILSKGHAAPILYAALFRAGAIRTNLLSLRKLTSPLEGHPMPRSLPWIKVATGSLGQGLSVGVGMAFAAKLQKRGSRTFVLLGDSEISEGSNYEAMQLASFYKLDNLIAFLDMNTLGQRGETMLVDDAKAYKKRFEGFGWNVLVVDGHSLKDILSVLKKTSTTKKPTMIIAKTIKGKGVDFLEGRHGWHGKALTKEQLAFALSQIPEAKFPRIKIEKPAKAKVSFMIQPYVQKHYALGDEIATREAYGDALSRLASSNQQVLALDAETSNSTYSEEVKETKPEQFIECFIAEQNMVGMGLGLEKKGYHVFCSSFSAFLSRAHDQIRMAALSSLSYLTICGSHAGISIGEDGPSQMGLEDLALFRGLPESIVLYPSDAVSTQKLVQLVNKTKGLKYIRTTRGKTPVIYDEKESFSLGDFKVVKSAKKSRCVLVGSGITLHESLKAHDMLLERGIATSVVDLYCIQPFNAAKFIAFVKENGSKVVVTEDHYKAGGIGEMLSSVLANADVMVRYLFVDKIPHSGKSEQLLEKYGISANNIMRMVERF